MLAIAPISLTAFLAQAFLRQLDHTSQLSTDPETISLIERNAKKTQENGASAFKNRAKTLVLYKMLTFMM